jgi:hypothetical protein
VTLFDSRRLVVVRASGTPSENRHEIRGRVQGTKAFFSPETDVEPGDVVEDAEGRSRKVRSVAPAQAYGRVDHLEARLGKLE